MRCNFFGKVDTQIPLPPRRVGILGCIKTEGLCTCVQQVCQSAGLIRRFPWRKLDWLQAWNKEAMLPDVSCVFGVYISPCALHPSESTWFITWFAAGCCLPSLQHCLSWASFPWHRQFWPEDGSFDESNTLGLATRLTASLPVGILNQCFDFPISELFFFSKNQWRTPTPKCFCYLSFVCWLRFALEGSPVPGCSSLESPSITRRGSPPGHRRAKLMDWVPILFCFQPTLKKNYTAHDIELVA